MLDPTNHRGSPDATLADRFVARGADQTAALCALNDHLLMANPRAAKCLLASDQQALWRSVRSRVADDSPFTMQLSVADKMLWLHCEPVFHGESLAGVLVDFDPTGARRAGSEEILLSAVPGSSVEAREARDQVSREIGSVAGTLITGAAGAGKSQVARALVSLGFPDLEYTIFDAAVQPLHMLEHRVLQDRVLVLLHIDALSHEDAQRAADLLRQRAFDKPVIATARADHRDHPIDSLLLGRIHVPSMADRVEDFPLIVASVFGALPGRPFRLTSDARRLLLSHEWNGNIAELKAVLTNAVASSPSRVIQASYIQLPRRVQRSRPRAGSLRGEERTAILMALQRSGGNKLVAADLLGIARSTLYKKLTSLDM